jgi:hypothetical protein
MITRESKTATSFEFNDWVVFLLASISIVLFLFYIDEGYYSFKWIRSVGAWIVFSLYTAGLFLTQLALSLLVSKKYTNRWRRVLALTLGVPIGLTLLFVIFS